MVEVLRKNDVPLFGVRGYRAGQGGKSVRVQDGLFCSKKGSQLFFQVDVNI
jgi:hypothetical protein